MDILKREVNGFSFCVSRGDHWSPVVVLKSDVEVPSCTKPPLRPTGTSPQGEAYKAPIEGNCRQSRLRGGEEKRRAVAEYSRRGDHWSPVWIVFFLFLHRIEKIGKI